MPFSDEFPSGEGDERERRLVRDLHRFYHAEGEDAQSLAHVRRRLVERRASVLDDPAGPQQRHDRPSPLRASPAQVKGTRSRSFVGRTWQRRLGSVAALLFVTLLVGSLVLVLVRARQNGANSSGIAGPFEALSSIDMLDSEIGWAVTAKGHVIRTSDGGLHWQSVTPNYPATGGQQKVVAAFLTSSTAWVAVSITATDGTTTVSVFRTTDGGQTWLDTTIQQSSPIYQITFVDAQHGWMLSKQADLASAEAIAILGTTDGGKTWTVVSSALAASTDTPPPGHLPFGGDKAGLGFANATTGWIAGSFSLQGYVFFYVTHDGAATWNRQTLAFPPSKASTQIVTGPPGFFSANDGILPVSFVTENAASLDLYVTHDGGASWTSTTPVAAKASISDVLDMNHAWASDGTLLYATTDGGQSWTKLAAGGGFQRVTRLDFVSTTTGWAIRSTTPNFSSLLKTVDGGQTWTVVQYTIS